MRAGILLLVSALLTLTACNQKADTTKRVTFFDMAGYFQQEAIRLQQAGKRIDKSVSKNKETERKQITVNNWKNELSLFIESDINKPAWRDSYRIKSTGDQLNYFSNNPDLRTKKITIIKAGNSIKRISILNSTVNSLYSSSEQLDYFPDSLYRIIKKQHVIFIGEHNYVITGRMVN